MIKDGGFFFKKKSLLDSIILGSVSVKEKKTFASFNKNATKCEKGYKTRGQKEWDSLHWYIICVRI